MARPEVEHLLKDISPFKIKPPSKNSHDVHQLRPHHSQWRRLQRMLQKGESLKSRQVGHEHQNLRWSRIVRGHASDLNPGSVTYR